LAAFEMITYERIGMTAEDQNLRSAKVVLQEDMLIIDSRSKIAVQTDNSHLGLGLLEGVAGSLRPLDSLILTSKSQI
jgi:hypothetical protein